MRNSIVALLAIVALGTGCAGFAGRIQPGDEIADQKCGGIYVSLGQTVGPCGLKGAAISVPGSQLVKGIAEALAAAWSGQPAIVNVYNGPEPEK